MPTILVITKETAQMQPDAIEATQLGRYGGVTCDLHFAINCHILFLTKSTGVPYLEWD